MLVVARVGQHGSFAFLPNNMVFSEQLVVFGEQRNSFFCTLQSRIHEIWARFFSSSMKDDLRYTPSDCFQTFPLPENWETNPALENIGEEYYQYRSALTVCNHQGLTDIYNRFHNPDENHPDILKLRQLHAECDRAVLDAYGWRDISTECTFLLDYEEEEEESTGRQKKKPWRYRWSEAVHDEVLVRLLQLNHERAEAEILAGQVANKSKAKATNKRASKTRKVEVPVIPDFLVETVP